MLCSHQVNLASNDSLISSRIEQRTLQLQGQPRPGYRLIRLGPYYTTNALMRQSVDEEEPAKPPPLALTVHYWMAHFTRTCTDADSVTLLDKASVSSSNLQNKEYIFLCFLTFLLKNYS